MTGDSNIHYWFDGGMREKNSTGSYVFHLHTPFYRADFDVFKGTLRSVDMDKEHNGRDEIKLHESNVGLPLEYCIAVTTQKGIFYSGIRMDKGTQAFIMDSGPIVHRCIVDHPVFTNESGEVLEGLIAGFEILFWDDRIYFICNIEHTDEIEMLSIGLILRSYEGHDWSLFKDETDKTVNGNWAGISQNGKSSLGFMLSEQKDESWKLINPWELQVNQDPKKYQLGAENRYTFGFQMFVINGDLGKNGWLKYHEENGNREGKNLKIQCHTIQGTVSKYEGYDRYRGCHVFCMTLDEAASYRNYTDELERYGYHIMNLTGRVQKPRLLWKKDGTPGVDIKAEWNKIWRPWGSQVIHRDENGNPTGVKVQVSKDFHEFENYPKHYAHCWLHAYLVHELQAKVEKQCEIAVAYGAFYCKIPAQFLQLSLLGWDDNPKYKHYLSNADIAGQIWIQGINGGAEVFCISPESMHHDNFYQDWRALRTGKKNLSQWATNFGGGDILRYERSDFDHPVRLVAPRIDFESYGPIISNLRFHFISEDEVFDGMVDNYLLAGDDYTRIYIHMNYTVCKDETVQNMRLFSFGAEEYNLAVLDYIAEGQDESLIMEKKLTFSEDEKVSLGEVLEGKWFVQHGIEFLINENKRKAPDNEAGRGVIIKRQVANLKNHPGLKIIPVPVKQVISDNPAHEPTLRIEFGTDEKELHLCKGDSMKFDVEIIIYPTKERSYDGDNLFYKTILIQCEENNVPYLPSALEAYHSNYSLNVLRGKSSGSFLPVIEADENGMAEFGLIGGIGFFPVTVISNKYPENVLLEEYMDGAWVEHTLHSQTGGKYQVDYNTLSGQYFIVIGIDSCPKDFEKLVRIFRITIKS